MDSGALALIRAMASRLLDSWLHPPGKSQKVTLPSTKFTNHQDRIKVYSRCNTEPPRSRGFSWGEQMSQLRASQHSGSIRGHPESRLPHFRSPSGNAAPGQVSASRHGRTSRSTPLLRTAIGMLLALSLAPLVSGCGAGHRLVPEADAGGKNAAGPAAAYTSQVYPMSVVPGGAYSTDALRQSAQADPVVRRALAEMAEQTGDPLLLEHLRVAQAQQDTTMHTQLREGDDLFWSRGRVTVRRGETIFVHDPTGTPVLRARCGNGLLPVIPAGARTRPAPRDPDAQQEPARPETSSTEEEPVATKVPAPEQPDPQSQPQPERALSEPEPSVLLTEVPAADSEHPSSGSNAVDGVTPEDAVPAVPAPAMMTSAGPIWDATAVAQNSVPSSSIGLTWLPGAIALVPLLLPDGGSSSDGPPNEEAPPTPELSSSVLILLSAGAGYGLLRLSRQRRRPRSVP